jgi:hypothetical protein
MVLVSSPFYDRVPFVPHTIVCYLVPYPFLENPFEIRLGIYAAAATLALVSFWALNAFHP